MNQTVNEKTLVGKNFLTLLDFSPEEVSALLDEALMLKKNGKRKEHTEAATRQVIRNDF